MSRAPYVETVCSIALDGTLKAISNVQIDVYQGGTTTHATIYSSRGGASVAQPLITGIDGLVEFWADAGDYDIKFHDLNPTPRIGDKTIGWAATPADEAIAAAFTTGDIILSVRQADYGRWLRLDGRSLSQSEIESALALNPGDAAAFVSFMGTGSSSKYGSTTGGKVKLVDTRRQVAMFAGGTLDTSPAPVAGTSARALGSAGGTETVTLTAAQSGLPAHGHNLNDPGHNHGVNDPGHGHNVTDGGHIHGSDGLNTASAGVHSHDLDQATNAPTTGSANKATGQVSGGNRNGHTYGDGAHTHDIVGVTDVSTSAITVNPHVTNLTIQNRVTGATVANAAGAPADNSHPNMPPFVTLGYAFIRV
jgi:hypothetical protein